MALLLASEIVFQALRLAGAAYLLYLGAQSLRQALRPIPLAVPPDAAGKSRSRNAMAPPRAFFQGVLNDLGNPKMAVFFASILPQFATPGQGMFSALVLLGLTFSLLTLAWLALYAAVISAAGGFLSRSGWMRWLDAVAGVVLIALGLRAVVPER